MDIKNFAEDVLDFLTNAIEDYTDSLKVIQNDHAYIHDGLFFSTYINKTITAGSTSQVSIVTPSNDYGYIHWRSIEVATSNEKVFVYLYEDSSSDTSGSTINGINHNRNVSRTSVLTVTESASISSDGNLVDSTFVGGGSGPGATGSGDFGDTGYEFVLKPSTNYKVSIVSVTISQTVHCKLKWYEEPYVEI